LIPSLDPATSCLNLAHERDVERGVWAALEGQPKAGSSSPSPPEKEGMLSSEFQRFPFSHTRIKTESRKRPDELTDLGSPKKSTKNPKRLLKLARRVSLKLGYFQIWNRERGWVNSIRYRYCEKMVPPSPILLLPVSYALSGGKGKKRKEKNIGVILLIFGDFCNVFPVYFTLLVPTN